MRAEPINDALIGRQLAPVHAVVEAGRLRFFNKVIGEASPVFTDAGAATALGHESVPVPPTYLACLEMLDADRPLYFLEDLGIDPTRILHGEQSFTYHAPAYVGDRVTFRTRVADVYTRKAGQLVFMVQETTATNQRGTLNATMRRTIIMKAGEAA